MLHRTRYLGLDSNKSKFQPFFILLRHFPYRSVAIVYGLRRSEILSLCWNRIDWEKRNIEVSMSVTKVNGDWLINDAMKTYGSKRKLHMSDLLRITYIID